LYRGGRVVTAVLCAVMAVICAVAAFIGYTIATAEPVVPGKPVDAGTAQTISLAALSCPALSGPRLAGQIMANSGFDPNASTPDGGTGIAAMSAADFKKWAPWPQATPRDQVADIYALAHFDCDLIGRVRLAKVAGDPWDAGLAAFHAGATEVIKAGKVPAAAQSYVNTVHGYGAWYAQQPEFTGAAQPAGTSTAQPVAAPDPLSTDSQAADPLPVPDADVKPVLTAGSVCAQVSAARVAAQLMAASGFNPNLQGADGAMGVAQFPPDLWAQYAAPSVSPWDPAKAIPVLGHAMCDLVRQLGALAGDSYPLAVAAFQVGQTAVRQAGKVPDIPRLTAFVARVTRYVDYYKQDARLGTASPAAPATPAPATTNPSTAHPSPPNTTGAAPKPPAPTVAKPPTTGPPAAPPTAAPPPPPAPAPPSGHLVGLGGNCLDVPFGDPSNGNQLVMWECNGYPWQQWTIEPDHTIRSLGKCLDVQWSGTGDGTNVQLWDCNGTAAQQWTVGSDGTIRAFGKCLDVQWSGLASGTKVWLWGCDGTAAQKWKLQ